MRKQDFLSRWSGLLGVWGRSRREKRDRPRTRSLHLEPLEVRQLLTVLTWDPNKDGTFGGTGNWSAENAWLDESTGTRCTWGSSRSGDTAIFKGTAGTVTVDTPSIQAAKLTFSVDSYTIDGANPLTLTGSTSVIANASATINDSLALTSSNQKWVIASGETLSVAQGVTFTNKRLEIQGSGVVTFGGALSGAELRVDTGGTATFAGSSSLTADLVRAGATTSGTINWDSDGTLTVGYCLYVGFNGGTGTFNQTDGRVTTVVHSTFNADVEFYASGTYNLIGGTLETICINGSFGAPAVSAGCSLNITDGTWMALGTFSVGSGLTVTVADGSVAHLNTEGYSVTLAGDVSGGGTLLKEGAGSLTLTGSTTHTGTVRIGAGTLVLGSSLALQSSLLDMNADDEGELSFGTLTAATLGGIQGSRGITIPSGVALTVGGTTSTYAGSITGSGQLIKAGSGTLKLSGDLTAFSGTWSVQQGTLLLGALDSVFADSDELTFSDLLSSALRVADAADSGGEIESWSISPAPTDGTFDISSDGIVSWTPGADCEAAAYAVTVTFAYDGGLQTKVLSFAVDHENTPPTFPCAGVDVGTPTGGWYSHELYYDVQPSGSTDVFNATFTAVDDGGSLTYELIGGPAGCQFNNSTGEVSFALSDDPYTAYEFYVKATDAEGLTDILHVLVSAWLTPTAHDAWLEYDSGDIILGYEQIDLCSVGVGVCPYNVPEGYKEFIIDEPPEHGTLTFSQDWNIVCYTPDEGYAGLDTFSYHMVYDGYGYDESSNYVCLGRYTTNVGVVQFQMDSYVDLAPTDPYETDDALVGEDQSTTLTLTLQNPRSDGCATAGYWQLDFMTTTYVRVYDAQGAEILPGSKHYDVVTGTQDQITLTVVGQTGGADDITARWTVWDGTHRVFQQDGSFVDIAGWCFFATDTVAVDVVEVDITRDGVSIKDKTTTVIVGQHIILKSNVIAPAQLATTDAHWWVPGDPIKGYSQTVQEAAVDNISLADLQYEEIAYYWIDAGNGLVVTYKVTAGGKEFSASATFNVLRPQATLTSQLSVGPKQIYVLSGDPGWLNCGDSLDPGITWSATVTTPSGGDGKVAFTQLVNTDRRVTLEGDICKTRTSGGEFILDNYNGIQYLGAVAAAAETTTTLIRPDYPAMSLVSSEKKKSVSEDFQLYLMYQPDGADSIWVTLRTLTWHWNAAATRDATPTGWTLDTGSSLSNTNSVNSTILPTWDTCFTNLEWV